MIEDVIKHLMATVPAVCEDGWLDDAGHYFCHAEGLSKAAAFKREQPDCLLELKGIVSPSVSTLIDLRTLQQRVWQNLAFSTFEASSVTFYREASVLRFITAHNKSSCLTGRMVIGGNHYYELVRRSEQSQADNRKQSKLNRLPSAPFQVDFADLDEYVLSVQEAQARNELATAADHQVRLSAALRTVEQITQYISTSKEEDLKSALIREALMFNLQQLFRQCHYFELRRYAGAKEWSNRLRAIPGFVQAPESVDAALVWSFCVNEVPAFAKLIASGPSERPAN
jgi:uncharacterized protein with HEPN domain